MISNPNELHVDWKKQELLEDGTLLFNLYANDADICHYPTGYIPMHWHKEIELFLLIKGNVKIYVGDQVLFLKAGEGCFINTEMLHSFRALNTSDCLFQSFVFDAGIVSGIPGNIFDTKYIRPLLEHGPDFLHIHKEKENNLFFEQFYRAFHACQTEEDAYEFIVRDALSQILLFIRKKVQNLTLPSLSKIQEQRLKQMLLYIDQNYEQKIQVQNIAKEAHICVRECQRIFQHYLQCTPMQYLQKRRLLLAAEKMITTDKDISEIAYDCGFSSPGYFSKLFKEVFGNTPRLYRQEIRERNLH